MKRLCAVLVAFGLLACDDPFEDLIRPVPEEPTEVTLWDFREGPFNRVSAFDVLGSRPVRPDQTPGWDFLFYLTEQQVPELRPYSVVAVDESDAGLQRVTASFEGLAVAPAEGYEVAVPLSIAVGDVLAMVSRRDPTGGFRCRRFGKLEVLAIDPEARTVTFRHLINPNCESRGLVPGQRGDR